MDNTQHPIKRTGLHKGVYLLPNLFTTGSLLLGFLAIMRSLEGEFITAAWAIFGAGVCDGLDGRVARLARAESDFGIEYDSLVDLVAFGVAPAVLMYNWALYVFPRTGWLVAFMFIACGAMRLARYNVQADTVERNYFQGLPIPMAAGMIICTVLFHYEVLGDRAPFYHEVLWVMTFLVAVLMVSNVRYRSFKQFDFRSRWSFFSLAIFAAMIAMIALEPQISIFMFCAVYIIAGPIEALLRLRRNNRFAERIRNRRARRKSRRLWRDKVRYLPDSSSSSSDQDESS